MAPLSFTLLVGMVPAPLPLMDAVEGIEVESAVDVASAFRLRLSITQTELGDWTVLQEDVFRPLVPVSVRVQAGSLVPEAVINGYVSSQRVTYSEQPGGSVLEITGMDATLLMNLVEKVMPWPSLPDGAIAATIFGQYALIPKVQPTPPVLVEPEGTTTQRGTDIRFLRKLAARNGFDCFVQPEPLTGLDVGYFQPRQVLGVPQAVLNVSMGTQTNVTDFRVRYEMLAPTTAIAAALDPATKAPQPGIAPASLQVPMGVEPALLRIVPPPIARPTGTGAARNPDLQTQTQALVDRSTWAVVIEGRCNDEVGVLRPGGLVSVRGVGRVFNGSYYVTRVHHAIGPDGYVQRFEAQRNAVGMTGAELYLLP